MIDWQQSKILQLAYHKANMHCPGIKSGIQAEMYTFDSLSQFP
jgi:hypothetical protein